MKIRSKLTKLEHSVTVEEWGKIKARGDASKYVIISTDEQENPVPTEAEKADYNNIVKDATKLFRAKKYEEAKVLYERAAAIKPTALITEKLQEIESYLDFKE